MKRLAELETRRRALIARCEAQRAELSWRLAQLSPRDSPSMRLSDSARPSGAPSTEAGFIWRAIVALMRCAMCCPAARRP